MHNNVIEKEFEMSELKDFEEKYISGKLIFDGTVLHVYDEEVLLPNNEKAKRELGWQPMDVLENYKI